MRSQFSHIFLPFILVIVSGFSAQFAFGQESPPLMTDDSGVPGNGKWENNIGFAFQGNNNKNILEGPIIDLNYGVGDHIQLNYEMAWVAENGEHFANKFDGVVLGIKYNFSNAKEDAAEFSLNPQAIFSFNNENGKKLEFGLILPAAISKEFSHFNISVQSGFQLLGGDTHGFYGIMVGREFLEKFGVMVEVHGVFAKSNNTTESGTEHEFFFNQETFVNIGLTFKVSEMVSILGAFGRKLNSAADAENGSENFGFAGLQFLM